MGSGAGGDPRGNELLVRLRVYPGFGYLMPPALGDTEGLRPDFERRMLMQITLSQAAAAITLLALAAAAVLWAVVRWGLLLGAPGLGAGSPVRPRWASVLPLFCRVRGAVGKEKGRLKNLSSTYGRFRDIPVVSA